MDHGTSVLDPALRSAEPPSNGGREVGTVIAAAAPPAAPAAHDDDEPTAAASAAASGRSGSEGQVHGHQDAAADTQSPQTPRSTHGSGETPHDALHPTDDPKRPRACEACRGLKVRCEPDATEPDGPCKRCRKAGRNCIVTMPTRKRQKKTDSRVAELERKIDALTASLQARGTTGAAAVATVSATPSVKGETPFRTAWGDHGLARTWSSHDDDGERRAYETNRQKRKFSERGDTADAPIDMPEASRPAPPIQMGADYADIVERGVLSADKASELFERYKTHMMPHMPAVVFPPGMNGNELRRSRPLLFLAIMSAASSESPNVQRRLVKELMQIFAEKIIITGEKSLEIVQALQVAVIWYWPPEHFEELKFYQLVHMGAVMALDIGLGRRTGGRKMQIPYQWRNHPFKRAPPPDPTSIECRRAWLASYFLAANTSMALHRPNLVRWTSFMAECMEMLQTNPEAAPTDRYFCHLVWTHRLAEEVGTQFAMDDPAVAPNITDSRTQYSLRMLERDLEKYSRAVPQEEMGATLKMSFHVLSLYMHEIALHTQLDDIRPPFDTATLKDGMLPNLTLTTSHINALSACLSAIDGIFEAFLSLEVPSIRCLPVFNFVRVAYAVVVLIKMYFSATAPGSELGKVIDKDNMKVEYYLDALLERFRVAASDDRSRPAAKFLVVLVMLRSWFLKQSKSLGAGPLSETVGKASTESSRASRSANRNATTTTIARATATVEERPAFQQTPTMQQEYPAANTPLHLLSEIAANDRSTGRDTSNNVLWNPPPARQAFVYDPSVVTATMDGSGPDTAATSGAATAMDGAASITHASVSWMPSVWSDDLQDMGIDMGLAEALSLEEFTSGFGASPASMTNGMRYVMAQDPWLSGLGSLGDIFEGMPGGGGTPMFPM